jgi:hypothetical protein
LAKRRAIARPIPFVPPVMRTAIAASFPLVSRLTGPETGFCGHSVRRLRMTRIDVVPVSLILFAWDGRIVNQDVSAPPSLCQTSASVVG